MTRVATVLLLSLMCGCSTMPKGAITPPPNGSIHLEYFTAKDGSIVRRNDIGEISAVVTPTSRVEQLIKQWQLAEFEEAIARNEELIARAKKIDSEHWAFYYALQSTRESLYISGVETWESVSQFLKEGDEIWTFGHMDTGTVIIRNGKLFCMIVVEHQY